MTLRQRVEALEQAARRESVAYTLTWRKPQPEATTSTPLPVWQVATMTEGA